MLLKYVSDLPTFITVYKHFIGYYKLQKCLCTNRANKIIIFVMCHIYKVVVCRRFVHVCVFSLKKSMMAISQNVFSVHSGSVVDTNNNNAVCVYDVRSQTQYVPTHTYTYTKNTVYTSFPLHAILFDIQNTILFQSYVVTQSNKIDLKSSNFSA